MLTSANCAYRLASLYFPRVYAFTTGWRSTVVNHVQVSSYKKLKKSESDFIVRTVRHFSYALVCYFEHLFYIGVLQTSMTYHFSIQKPTKLFTRSFARLLKTI